MSVGAGDLADGGEGMRLQQTHEQLIRYLMLVRENKVIN